MYIMAKKFFEEFVSKYNIKEGNITNTYYYKYRHTYLLYFILQIIDNI